MVKIVAVVAAFAVVSAKDSEDCKKPQAASRKYAQCGGYTYHGETCCPADRRCEFKTAEYSQCSGNFTGGAKAYEQCSGGPDYTGPTFCAKHLKCVKSGPYYSGCQPRKALTATKTCKKAQAVSRKYAQCGGYTYHGETCCPKGRGCAFQTAEYSQCKECAKAYEQCAGGPGYNGSTCCQKGFKCKSSGDYYSGCVAEAESDDVEVSQSLGAYIASYARSVEGQRIDRGECWDLANEAIIHAKAAGFKVASSPSTYQWSSHTVNYQNAQPGDILQFVNYHEKTPHGSRSTADHHTAVVTKSFDSSSGGIEVEQQNPKPVSKAVYHPGSRTGGSMTVYRMSSSMVVATVVV